MIVAGLGRRLPQQLVPHGRRARRGTACRTGCSPGRGRTPTRRTAMPGPADRPRRRDGRVVRPLAAAADGAAHRDRCDVFVRTSTRPEPDLDLHEGYWLPLPTRAADAAGHAVPLAGPAVARRRPRRRHRRLDRLRRPPALGAVDRPAPRRRPLADLGLRPPPDAGRRAPGGAAAGQRRRPGGLAVGQALRRLPRRHLRAGHPRHARPRVPRRRPRRAVAAGAGRGVRRRGRPRRVRLRVGARATAAGQRRRRRLAQHGRAARRRSRSPSHERLARAAAADGGRTRRRRSPPGAEHSSETAEGVAWTVTDDVLRRTTHAAHPVAVDVRRRPTTARAREDYRGEVQRRPAHLRADRARRDHVRAGLARRRRARRAR